MNMRNSGYKSEVENLYKTAIENLSKLKPSTQNTLHASTPFKSSESTFGTAAFSLDESEISDKTLVFDGSADSEDIATQPVRDSSDITSKRQTVVAIPKSRGPDGTMTHPNLFATLKYTVEAVPFFDDKNIPLNYFIEGCEEAKSMLPDEVESQFTKIIRTRIVGEARVQETVADTLRIERELHSMTDLRQNLENTSSKALNTNKLRETCQICYKEGHSASYCRKLTNFGTKILICQICKYINSKFVYVERHIQPYQLIFIIQINQLYRNILLQQRQLEYQTMQNALAIAATSPDIFAYHFMKGPGYMALLAGEVIHMVKCVPVEVKLAQTNECYEQLPVIRGNETYFLTPQTHVLSRHGTQITCNSFAPTMYLLGNSWYKIMPKSVETLPSTVMKPSTKPSWKYKCISPGALATSGIYSQTDLEELKDHIMFPAERPAILNTMARGILGHSTVMNGGSLSNLIDEASIERIAISAWKKFWNKFLIFGNISAGLIGIYLIARVIKLLLDTFVHGYALHTVYGWSVYLLGDVWDSLTQLLLHLGRNKPKDENPSAPDLELQKHNETETKLEPIYLLLPPREETAYTLELKN
ncbi:hypothetical protein ALC57_15751 [Trachymyrmex cornetzi]|uniref:Uncharacterized protein n=1 Tax=Trachymyrmex cornetzi TaxID=471704 RepID=A0A151IW87_9HYME|nr:hypothetical protein ALC57_15751 [Trachymyrmex cornetzi]